MTMLLLSLLCVYTTFGVLIARIAGSFLYLNTRDVLVIVFVWPMVIFYLVISIGFGVLRHRRKAPRR